MEINQNVQSGKEDKDVLNALDVIKKHNSIRRKQDSMNDNIQWMFESAFTISNPKGTQKLDSQLLYQAMWRTCNRMKPLDFAIHGTQRPLEAEKIVTDGVGTIMDRGGYDSCLRDKNGIFFNTLLYGDSFMQIGASDKNSKSPISFSVLSNANIYVDSYATAMRSQGHGRNCRKMVVIFSYSWEEFIEVYPKAKKKAGIGKIPRDAGMKDLPKSFDQTMEMDDEIEVAYCYDLDTKTYLVIAGEACTVLEKHKKDKYPFIKDKEAYIPVSQFMCIPSAEGFYNKGIGHLCYKLAMLTRQLMNLEVGHITENVFPINIVSVPQGQSSKFFAKMKMAQQMRAQGKTAAVALEYDPTAPTGISNQSMTTQNLFGEWQAVFDRLVNELKRNGINIDELDQPGQQTATEIMRDEETSNAFVKQIQEGNASEYQFLVELTMDMITNFVSKNSKIPLNLTTKIGDQRADEVTMGMVSEELKKYNYFVRIDSRSGAIPSGKMLMAAHLQMLNFAQPGSEAQKLIIGGLSGLHNMDIPADQYFMAEQAPQQAPEANEELSAEGEGTERLEPKLENREQIMMTQ